MAAGIADSAGHPSHHMETKINIHILDSWHLGGFQNITNNPHGRCSPKLLTELKSLYGILSPPITKFLSASELWTSCEHKLILKKIQTPLIQSDSNGGGSAKSSDFNRSRHHFNPTSPHSILSKSGGRYFVSEKSLSFYLKTGQMMFCKIFIFGILKMSFSAHIHFDFWPHSTLKDISRDKLLHHHHPTDLYDQGKGRLFTQYEVFIRSADWPFVWSSILLSFSASIIVIRNINIVI